MNRKQRRMAQSGGRRNPDIILQGKSYTIAEANVLAVKEYGRGNPQAAMDIFRLILTQAPDDADTYSNQGVILHELKQYKEALASCDQALTIDPGNAPAYYNRANVLQSLGRFDEALANYDQAITHKADYADAYNNRGNSLQALGRIPDALASYDKAVVLRPDFAKAHNNRSSVLYELKRYEEALASCDKAIALKLNAAEAHNNRGNALQALGRFPEALASYDEAIALKPGFAEAYNNRGNALQALKRFPEALANYDKAIALKSDYAQACYNRAGTLHELHRFEEALASYDKAVALRPGHAETYNNRGVTLRELKRYDESIASCRKAIALKPDYAGPYHNTGIALVDKGNMASAEKMFEKALALKPDFPNSWFSLSNIRTYRDAEHRDIKAIQKALDAHGDAPGRDYFYFALGKIYDDCGLYDKAFEYYRQANELLGADVAYNPGATGAHTDAIIETFSKEFLAQRFSFASDSRTPVFIVGMPRSGTTLMASILSNHPAVATAGELLAIAQFTTRLPELSPYPQAVRDMAPAIARRLVEAYEGRLRRDAAPGIPYVIDKYPLNFWHLGFIAMLFPNAYIIHCRRHPLDTAVSNYFRRFGFDYSYSFDLQNIGHFYGEYARLMDHWHKALPIKMIDISYEDMTMKTEAVARRALDFLGLEWDARCLSPHTNLAPVETASNWQVRQPIYTQAVERWRHYEKYLVPLKKIPGLRKQ